jgi:hypothetical protein
VVDTPPVAAVLAGFTVTGQTHGDIAELVLDGTATALAKGWSTLALPGGLALTDFTPDDKRVVLQRSGDAMQLHLPEPGTYHFSAHLSFPISRDAGGRRTLALVLPVAGAGRLDLLIADSEAEVALDPVVAATTIPGKGGTRVQAVLGGASNLAVAWQPPVQQVAGEALILADHQLRLTVAERSLRYDLAAQLTILRRPIDTITLTLPPDTQVLAVEARTLRTWEKTGDSVVLHLHEPVEGPYPVALRLERLLPALAPGASRTVDVAWPLVAAAGRSTGSVAVVQAEGLAVAVERADGLAQVDPAEIAGGQGAVSAFRFLAPPAASAIAVTRLQSDLRVAVHQLVRLGVEEDLIAVVLQLDVRKAGVFALALDVPAGWELADLSGLSVDDTRLGKPEGGVRRLDIALRGRLLGAGEAVLRFRAPASIPRDAATAAAPIVLPLLQLQGAHQVRGTLAIAGPRSWALASGARSALGGAEAEQVRREGPLATLAHELKEDEDLPLAFTVLGPGAGVTLAATPRARELAVVQEEAVSVAEGRVRSLVTLRGEVRYSAAAAVHVRLPSALDAQVVFGGALLAEHVAGAREGGLTTWELRFQAPVLGPFTLTIDSAQELPALSPGTPISITVPAASVAEPGLRLTRVVAVARTGTIEVTAGADGLDSLAAADLPAGLQGQGVVAGFHGSKPGALTLELVRHDLVAMADGAVAAARYTAVLGDDQVLRVRGDLVLATRGRPWLDLRLPEGAELLEVAVDRHQGRPSRRPDGSVVVPLGDGNGLRSQRVAFIYEQRVGDGRVGRSGNATIALPHLGTAPQGEKGEKGPRPLPVGRVECVLFVPDALAAYGWSGDLERVAASGDAWSRLLAGLGATATARGADAAPLPGGDDGLTVPLPIAGTPHQLVRLGDGGSVHLRWIDRDLLGLLALAAALAGGVLVWLARRRSEAVGALAIAALVLGLAAAGAWFPVIAGFALGVGAVVALLVVRGLLGRFAAWRVPVPAVAPDPWLEAPHRAMPATAEDTAPDVGVDGQDAPQADEDAPPSTGDQADGAPDDRKQP